MTFAFWAYGTGRQKWSARRDQARRRPHTRFEPAAETLEDRVLLTHPLAALEQVIDALPLQGLNEQVNEVLNRVHDRFESTHLHERLDQAFEHVGNLLESHIGTRLQPFLDQLSALPSVVQDTVAQQVDQLQSALHSIPTDLPQQLNELIDEHTEHIDSLLEQSDPDPQTNQAASAMQSLTNLLPDLNVNELLGDLDLTEAPFTFASGLLNGIAQDLEPFLSDLETRLTTLRAEAVASGTPTVLLDQLDNAFSFVHDLIGGVQNAVDEIGAGAAASEQQQQAVIATLAALGEATDGSSPTESGQLNESQPHEAHSLLDALFAQLGSAGCELASNPLLSSLLAS